MADRRAADSLAFPDFAGLKAAGYEGWLGYTRVVTREVIDRCLGVGLWFSPIVEHGAADALGGYDKGTQHGNWANAWAQRVDCPPHVLFWATCDTDIGRGPSAKWDAVRDYCRGLSDALGGHPIGFYGGIDTGLWLLDQGTVTDMWDPEAFSWNHGVTTDRTTMSQRGHLFFGTDTDRNWVYKDFPAWGMETGDEIDMASMQDLRNVVREEVESILHRGVGRSVLASRRDAKGVLHVLELFPHAGIAKHLGPVGYQAALALGVPNIGEHGEELFDRFFPIEGSWPES